MYVILLIEQELKKGGQLRDTIEFSLESWLRSVPGTRDGEIWSDLQYVVKLSLTELASMCYYRGIEGNF